MNYIQTIEKKYLTNSFINNNLKRKLGAGDIVKIGYSIIENNKERIQYYEGIIIALNNKGLNKTFTIRRKVQGIGVEQIFSLNSPKIISILTKQSLKIRRAKLYFYRFLKGNSIK